MAGATASTRLSGFLRRQGTAFVEWWKTLGNDYVSTIKGAFEEGRSKPWKGVSAVVGSGVLTYAHFTCPDELSMWDDLRERRQLMATIPASEHSRKTDAEMSLRTALQNQRRLEHYNMLFFSFLVRREYDTDVRIYHTQDPNLNSWWITSTLKNIMDVGAFGRWYHLERAFVNYDINEEEEFPSDEKSQ
ncbi:hypothetical protein PENTCL1PPCAC_27187 [Pristionchus entomophagus]|uniref:Uncharacterized protein n=1 Tax=Pristionchus entomophagus TaxID=358040 RepID=A0AAV5UEC0_9BILA|nr:hypothetical protein PENTCL1PPCAC_27187 [Pristionchus entomophagus]